MEMSEEEHKNEDNYTQVITTVEATMLIMNMDVFILSSAKTNYHSILNKKKIPQNSGKLIYCSFHGNAHCLPGGLL